MADQTNISWCDMTWSPWYGCTQVSMGPQGACEGCYARQLAEVRFGRVVFGGPGRGEGTRDVRADAAWKEPLKWEREAAAAWKAWTDYSDEPWPYSPFVFPSMCDPFDNHPALVDPRRRFFDLIRATPNLTWLLLTKRPGNIARLYGEMMGDLRTGETWPSNAAIGCTVVSQEEADRDVPKLLAAKAALRPAFAFLSMEPLLGPVDLTALRGKYGDHHHTRDALRGTGKGWPDATIGGVSFSVGLPRLDWVITGGETDQGAHKARPSDPAWFRSLRDQCAAAGVPFHFKQHGEWVSVAELPVSPDHAAAMRLFPSGSVARVGKANAPCTLDGVRHDARPELAHV